MTGGRYRYKNVGYLGKNSLKRRWFRKRCLRVNRLLHEEGHLFLHCHCSYSHFRQNAHVRIRGRVAGSSFFFHKRSTVYQRTVLGNPRPKLYIISETVEKRSSLRREAVKRLLVRQHEFD